MSKARPQRRRRRWVLPVILVLVGISLFGAWEVSGILYDYKSAREAYDTIADNAVQALPPAPAADAAPDGAPQAEIPFTIDWDYLRGVNSEVIGWLWCPGTRINYPVLQHTDNQYYLTHGFNGKYNPGGALFSDPACILGTELCNYVIYGHQMNDGSMFDLLNSFADPAAYQEHPLFYFLTPDANYRVELIAAHIVEAVPESYPGYFADAAEYQRYLDQITALSTFTTAAAVDPGRQLLTMSTCNYARNYSDPRMLVQGLLVPLAE